MFNTGIIGFEPWVISQPGKAQNITKPAKLGIITNGDNGVAIGNLEHLIGHDIWVLVAQPLWGFATN